MNAVSELIKNRRKLVRDVACLAAEGRLSESVLSEGHQLIYNLLTSLLLAKIKENAGVIIEQIRSITGSELFSHFFLPCSLFVSFFFRVLISPNWLSLRFQFAR